MNNNLATLPCKVVLLGESGKLRDFIKVLEKQVL
jgi:hypothetical protein